MILLALPKMIGIEAITTNLRLNPEFAIERGSRQNILAHLKSQKASTYFMSMSMFFVTQSEPI